MLNLKVNTIIPENGKKRDLALDALKSGLDTDQIIFKRQRNKVTSELRKAKVNFLTL